MAISAPIRVYEEFTPSSELVSEQGSDVFRVPLPGFKKDQLKVQLTTSHLLKVSGERPIGESKWRRFLKEFQVPPNCNVKEITAKFEGGILHIKLPSSVPNITTHKQDETKPTVESPKPERPPSPSNVSEKDEKLKAIEEKVGKENEEVLGKKDEEKGKLYYYLNGVKEASKAVVSNGRSFLMGLKKPEPLMKNAIIPAVVLLILGLYTIFMFKSFSGIEDQQQGLLEYDQEL